MTNKGRASDFRAAEFQKQTVLCFQRRMQMQQMCEMTLLVIRQSSCSLLSKGVNRRHC